jgi:hypothetical protein
VWGKLERVEDRLDVVVLAPHHDDVGGLDSLERGGVQGRLGLLAVLGDPGSGPVGPPPVGGGAVHEVPFCGS